MIAKFLSRRIDANTLDLLHARIQPSANPCNTKERHSGSSVDDLPFWSCDAYKYSGDGQVASFISSTKHLKHLGFEMNSIHEVAFNENFEAIGQALTAHYADLEEIAAAESDIFFFLSTWILGGIQ